MEEEVVLQIKSCKSLGIGNEGELAVIINGILIVHWGSSDSCLDFYSFNKDLAVDQIVLKKNKKEILDINRLIINDQVTVEREHE